MVCSSFLYGTVMIVAYFFEKSNIFEINIFQEGAKEKNENDKMERT